MADETSERIDGPTPNGGVYSVAHFLDGERQPTTKDKARFIEVYEYDENGVNVGRTWLDA